MSLVMAFATENFAVLSGDFRRTNIDDDNIHYDDTQKVFKINSKVLGGFTGDCDVSFYLQHALRNISDNATVEAVARFVKKELITIKRENLQQTVILTGISDSGKIIIMQISHHENFKIIKIKVPQNEIKWQYSISYVDPGPYIESLFEEIEDCTPANIAALAKVVNEKVGETDIRVSKPCRILSLEKN
jgi:hypothetical protein